MKSWKRMAAAALTLWFLTGTAPVRASPELEEVALPVSASGAGCTAVLYDESGAEAERITLPENGTGYFSIRCDGLGEHIYTVRLAEAPAGSGTGTADGTDSAEGTGPDGNAGNSDGTVYDPTVYTVKAAVFLKKDLTAGYAVTVTADGTPEGTGKLEGVRFINIKRTPDPPSGRTADARNPKSNSGSAAKDTETGKVQTGRLPQTGTLLWLVPPLAGAGFLCILTGLALRRKKGVRHETKRG